MTEDAIPALSAAIRNPNNPAHLMVLKEVPRRVRVYTGDVLLADSTAALRVMEIGKTVYDPVIYIPQSDLVADFEPVDRSTHCPIKGDASYIALNSDELGWVYRDPIPMTRQLKAHYAFWPSKTRLVEGD